MRNGEACVLVLAPETTLAAAVRAEEVAERIIVLAAMAAIVAEQRERLRGMGLGRQLSIKGFGTGFSDKEGALDQPKPQGTSPFFFFRSEKEKDKLINTR